MNNLIKTLNLLLAQIFLVANFLSAHTVTFDLGTEGTLLSGELTQNIASGGTAIAPEFSVAEGFAFIGWDQSYHDVNDDLTITAQYSDASLVGILEEKVLSGDGAPFDLFGYSVSVSGDTALVGAHGNDDNGSASGSAYVFVRSNGVWTEQDKLTAGDSAPIDFFGYKRKPQRRHCAGGGLWRR